MPKETRRRVGGHAQSVRLPKRQFAVQENALQQVDVGSQAEAPGSQILDALNEQDRPITLKKKEKQALKHELFLKRLETSQSPYSKSHQRRLKRKQREQVASGMSDMKEALSAVEDVIPDAVADATASDERPKRKQAGQIGEGKGVPLTKAQRKRVLKTERFRIPKILATPEFAANPFETIRTHAQNTLLKHQLPKP